MSQAFGWEWQARMLTEASQVHTSGACAYSRHSVSCSTEATQRVGLAFMWRQRAEFSLAACFDRLHLCMCVIRHESRALLKETSE